MPQLPTLSGCRFAYDLVWHPRAHYGAGHPSILACCDRLHRFGCLLECFGSCCLTFIADHVCSDLALAALLFWSLPAISQVVLDHAGIFDRDRAVACRVGASIALRRPHREL